MNMKGKKGSVRTTDLPFYRDARCDEPSVSHGWKREEFHLIAEPRRQEIVPGRVVESLGLQRERSGTNHQVTRGDRVRIIVE